MITKVVFDLDVVRFVNTGAKPFTLTMPRVRSRPVGSFTFNNKRKVFKTESVLAQDHYSVRGLFWWMCGTQLAKPSEVTRGNFILLSANDACRYKPPMYPQVETPLFPIKMWDVTPKHWDLVMWGLINEYVATRIFRNTYMMITSNLITYEDILL